MEGVLPRVLRIEVFIALPFSQIVNRKVTLSNTMSYNFASLLSVPQVCKKLWGKILANTPGGMGRSIISVSCRLRLVQTETAGFNEHLASAFRHLEVLIFRSPG